MQRKTVVFFCCLFSFLKIDAQPNSVTREHWEEKPVLHTLKQAFVDEPVVVILEKARFEYIDEAGDNIAEYYTRHSIIRINNEKGIESYNRIYLGATNSIEIVDVRARTILPDGKIIEIDKGNIKDIKEDDGNMYKIFAMEGLEKGCEVEYYYTYKRESSYFGRMVLQGGSPVEEYRFEIMAPERLSFEIKPYNTTLDITDTVIQGKRVLSTGLKDINGIENEKYASYRVNLKRLEFKLSYNAVKKGERLFTWNELAKRMYGQYTSWKEKELSKIDDLVKQSGWDKLSSEEEKVISIENFLKKNFTTRDDIEGEDAANIEVIVKKKIASFRGIMRLYSGIFRQLNINYQFVFVCDRNDYLIDKNFENWNNCDLPIFYFPLLRKYMAPSRPDFRYPYVYPDWGAANGLFCKTTSIGNFTTAIAEIRQVDLEGFAQNYDNIDSRIELNEGLDTVLVKMKQLYGGYAGQFYRAAYNFASAEDQRSMIKALIKFGTSTENVVSSEVLNPEFTNTADNKPFVLQATVKASELLERAGNKLLLKIGEIIGPQVEMYQEKTRQLPVKIEFPHFEDRKIEFVIPAGYAIKNINDLKLENVFREGGEIIMGFSSDYKLEGNILTVHILEEYRKTIYPVSQFAEFKKIINTSADFNKIVLVLEKK